MKLFLKLLFCGIFLWMTVMTIRTSLAMSLWQAWPAYAANPWAVATLWDAYFGFLTFYVWVVYKARARGVAGHRFAGIANHLPVAGPRA